MSRRSQFAVNKLALKITADINEAAILLRRIPNDDPINFSDFVRSRLATGEYKSFDILFGETTIGVTVYSIEEYPGGYKELISIATYTKEAIPGFQDFWQTEIENVAKRNGCKSIRFHTVRHGLIKLSLLHGWHVAEIVMRKRI